MNVFLALLDAYLAGDTTLYFGSAGFNTGPSDTPANTHFAGRIAKAASIRRDMFDALTTFGRSRVGYGSLELINNAPDFDDEGALDYLLDYAFDGRAFQQWFGPQGGTFPTDFTQIIEATMTNVEVARGRARVILRDRQAELDVPIQSNKYTGSGGLDGGAELAGKPKPFLLGEVFNVTPVLVDPAKNIYQVNDGAVDDIPDVRDRGISLAQTPANLVARTSGVSTRLNKPASNGTGTIIIVGASGVIRRSTDYGATWAAAASSPLTSTPDLYAAVWDPTIAKFLVGGNSGNLWYSADGDTFTQITGGSNPFGAGERINKLVSNGAGTILGLGSAGIIGRSTNGTSFASQTHGFSTTNIIAGYWGRNEFAAINTVGRVESSPTGVTWTAKNAAVSSSGGFTGIAFGKDRYVAVADLGTGQGDVYSSLDLVSWFRRSDASISVLRDIEYGGKFRLFVAAGGTGTLAVNSLHLSADGERWWTVSTNPASSTDFMDPVYGICLTPTEATLCGQNNNGSAEGYVVQVADVGTYASEADLQDDTLQPPPGTYKVHLASGRLRAGSTPIGQLTADVVQGASAADRTAGQLFAAVMTKVGLGSDYSTDDVDDLDAVNDGVCGIYIGAEERRANTVLDEIANTVGGSWFPDRLGVFRIKQLVAPEGLTPSRTLRRTDMLKPLEVRETQEPGKGIPTWRTVVRYRKNYTVQTTDLAGGVSQADRAAYAQQWQDAVDEDASVQTAHLLATERVFESLFAEEADALAEAQRRQAMRGVKRRPYETAIKMTEDTLEIDIADCIELVHPRFGLSAGKNVVVMMIEPVHEAHQKSINIGFWG